MTTTMNDYPLSGMQADVWAWCHRKGWAGEGAPAKTFGDCMALLHSEVSEATEAYRRWDTEDVTIGVDAALQGIGNPKPEGVGSEFADILIRLLDDCARYDFNLSYFCDILEWTPRQMKGWYLQTFGDQMAYLHYLISQAIKWYCLRRNIHMTGMAFANIYLNLRYVCEQYNIDLLAEYKRKMEYNEGREFRHGGRKL